MLRKLITFVTLCLPALLFGQVAFPEVPKSPVSLAYEDKDWGVEATATARRAAPHAPTPTSIPGGRVIKTLELKALLESNKNVVVIDALDSKTRTTIPGAFWMPGIGDGQFFGVEKARFAAALDKLTGGDKAKPIVFLCVNSECWLSYNASLYAIGAGYKDVIWYRGGTGAWAAASLELKKPESVSW